MGPGYEQKVRAKVRMEMGKMRRMEKGDDQSEILFDGGG